MDSATSDIISLTPAMGVSVDSEITFAHKKEKKQSLLGSLKNMTPSLRYEWLLTDGRIGGYVFDKEERCVKLYTLDTPGTCFTNDMHHISFNAEEWQMAKPQFWKDLGVSRQDGDQVLNKIEIIFKMCLLEDRCNAIKVRPF